MGNTNNNAKKYSGNTPKMPSVTAQKQARAGGLGKGLAALIPQRTQTGSIGGAASDVIFGSAPTQNSQATEMFHHSDDFKTSRTKGGDNNRDLNFKNESTLKSENKGQDNTQEVVLSSTAEGTGMASENFGASYREISLDSIMVNSKQPRTVFDEEALNELVHSIKEFGLMQPIVVRPISSSQKDKKYSFELIMGERRLRASKKAGLKVIPAIVRETEDSAMLRDALLENIHRVQLNPLEEAAAYQQLLEEFGVTQAELAKKIGRSRPLITNMIRLLQLPISVQRRVGAGVLSNGHARALLSLKAGAAQQEALADRIIREGMSVRATEEAVMLINRSEDSGLEQVSPKKTQRSALPKEVSAWASRFGDHLDTKVSVQMGKKKGKIVVEFGGPEDFERIAEILNLQEK